MDSPLMGIGIRPHRCCLTPQPAAQESPELVELTGIEPLHSTGGERMGHHRNPRGVLEDLQTIVGARERVADRDRSVALHDHRHVRSHRRAQGIRNLVRRRRRVRDGQDLSEIAERLGKERSAERNPGDRVSDRGRRMRVHDRAHILALRVDGGVHSELRGGTPRLPTDRRTFEIAENEVLRAKKSLPSARGRDEQPPIADSNRYVSIPRRDESSLMHQPRNLDDRATSARDVGGVRELDLHAQDHSTESVEVTVTFAWASVARPASFIRATIGAIARRKDARSASGIGGAGGTAMLSGFANLP